MMSRSNYPNMSDDELVEDVPLSPAYSIDRSNNQSNQSSKPNKTKHLSVKSPDSQSSSHSSSQSSSSSNYPTRLSASLSNKQSDNQSNNRASPLPFGSLNHADVALLDTIFSLLFNVSITFIISSIILFICVFSLPSRTNKVDQFNQSVNQWDRNRDNFGNAVFNLSVLMNDQPVNQFQLQQSHPDDRLTDDGGDLHTYQSLRFEAPIEFVRPQAQSGPDAVEVIKLMITTINQSNNQFVTFNVSLPTVIRTTSAPLTMTQSRCVEFNGRWHENTCEYFETMDEACVKVISSNDSWALFDGTGPWLPPPVVVINGTNTPPPATLADLDPGYGCSRITSEGKWSVGKYHPLTEDPFIRTAPVEPTRRRLLSIDNSQSINPSVKHLNSQRHLLSEDDITSTAADSSNSSSTAESFSSSYYNSSSSSSSAPPSSSSSSSSDDYSSSSSSTGMPAPPAHQQQIVFEIRHRHDPYLVAMSVTESTLWFGIARHSLLLLSFWLFILGVLFMLGRIGTRYGFWCGLLWLSEALQARQQTSEPVSLGRAWDKAKDSMKQKIRRGRHGARRSMYSHVGGVSEGTSVDISEFDALSDEGSDLELATAIEMMSDDDEMQSASAISV